MFVCVLACVCVHVYVRATDRKGLGDIILAALIYFRAVKINRFDKLDPLTQVSTDVYKLSR